MTHFLCPVSFLRHAASQCLGVALVLCTTWGGGALATEPQNANHPAPGASTENLVHEMEAGEKFDVSETLMHHVIENHDWHIMDLPGTNGYTEIAVHLPWMLYHSEKGFQFFMLSEGSEHANEEKALQHGYALSHGKLHPVRADVQVLEAGGIPSEEFAAHLELDEAGNWVPKKGDHHVVRTHSGVLYAVDTEASVLDFSISKTPLHMMIVALLMLLVFTSVARAYKKRGVKSAPKGLQSLVEPVIMFVEENIAAPNMHGKHKRFMPYLLTLFFFIWISNMLGLMPLSSNIAGNISVTAALAALTLLVTWFSSNKAYWQHIFWFPGVPTGVKFIMMPVEIVGMFTKPFSLTIRLFANIAGGHFMVLALVSLIFILGDSGKSAAGAYGIMPLSVAFTLFILTLEVLVAALQAYVFTMLTAVFIGQAMESHDHHHEHATEDTATVAHA
ncbi:MAG: F0F1 ATP synthase subunit A [Sphingobacteriia bacterium]